MNISCRFDQRDNEPRGIPESVSAPYTVAVSFTMESAPNRNSDAIYFVAFL